MEFLSKLTIADDLNADKVSATVKARTRLIASLNEQLKAAEAMVAGEVYELTRTRWETNEDTGERKRVPYKVPLRKWYWRDVEGKARFAMRVGNKRLELMKGKTNVLVGEDAKLPEVIKTCISAAEAGELDDAITALLATRKPRTQQKATNQAR